MNDDEIPVSIDDTILILSRAAQGSGSHNLSEITLVGGQALNFWADRYFGSRGDFVSGDIDLLGGTTEALRCARAWNAKINVANMDSAMGSPNTAVVLIDRGAGNLPLRVDFLGNLIGLSVRDVLKARFEVLAKQGFSFHVMHPLHIMESRIGNAFYLGRKDESAMRRLELSFLVTKAHIQNLMTHDARSGLKLVERVVDVVLSERGKMSWYAGHDPMAAIPIPADTSEYPPLFSEKRWPQIVSEVTAKRDAYAGTMQQIEAFNRQRQQKEAAAVLERSFHDGLLQPPSGGGTITGTVRALVNDANMNAFALVETEGKTFAVPVSDLDRGQLSIRSMATFRVAEGAGPCPLMPSATAEQARTYIAANDLSKESEWPTWNRDKGVRNLQHNEFDDAIHAQLIQNNNKFDAFAASMDAFNCHSAMCEAMERATKYGMDPKSAIHEALDNHPALKKSYLNLHKNFHEHIQPAMEKHMELIGQMQDPDMKNRAMKSMQGRMEHISDAQKHWPDRDNVMQTQAENKQGQQGKSGIGDIIARFLAKLKEMIAGKHEPVEKSKQTGDLSATVQKVGDVAMGVVAPEVAVVKTEAQAVGQRTQNTQNGPVQRSSGKYRK